MSGDSPSCYLIQSNPILKVPPRRPGGRAAHATNDDARGNNSPGCDPSTLMKELRLVFCRGERLFRSGPNEHAVSPHPGTLSLSPVHCSTCTTACPHARVPRAQREARVASIGGEPISSRRSIACTPSVGEADPLTRARDGVGTRHPASDRPERAARARLVCVCVCALS